MAHLRKRGKKKWQIVIEMPRDPVSGDRRRKYRTVNCTKSEAKKKMRKMVYEMENGMMIEPSEVTYGELLQEWLEGYCKPNLAARSYSSYKMIVDRHITPALGDIKLQDLKAFHIQSYQSQKLRKGRKDGKDGGLSPTTVRKHNHLISQSLNYAVQMEMLKSNPAKTVSAPKREDKEIMYLKKDEIETLLDACPDDGWMEKYIYFSIRTGMRRGEVLGLRWKDVDLNDEVINVNQTLQRVRNKGINFKSPKTRSGRRSIVINSRVVEILNEIRKDQNKNKLSHGKDYYTDQNLVFCNDDGSPVNPQGVTRRFKKIAKKAGFPELRLHDLRHTHATLLMRNGVNPKVVQQRLGHKNISQTLDTYSHVSTDLQRDAVERISI